MANQFKLKLATNDDWAFFNWSYYNSCKSFLFFDETRHIREFKKRIDFFGLKDLPPIDYDKNHSKDEFYDFLNKSYNKLFIIYDNRKPIGTLLLSKSAKGWKIDDCTLELKYQTTENISEILKLLIKKLEKTCKTLMCLAYSPMCIEAFLENGFEKDLNFFTKTLK